MPSKLDRIQIAGQVRATLPHAIDSALAMAAESECPNGDAAFAMHRGHLRQHLLDMIAALDQRPSAILPVQLPPLAVRS